MTIDMVDNNGKPAKIIKADTSLQKKIGNGPLDERIVTRCQNVIDNNGVDFGPLAQEFLTKLRDAIATARKGSKTDKSAIQSMTEPVMQLKANAAVFRYTLIGNLANVMLGFLEAVNTVDDDVLEIISAHEKTLSVIIAKKMHGPGGVHGKLLEEELQNACKRYLSKKKNL